MAWGIFCKYEMAAKLAAALQNKTRRIIYYFPFLHKKHNVHDTKTVIIVNMYQTLNFCDKYLLDLFYISAQLDPHI